MKKIYYFIFTFLLIDVLLVIMYETPVAQPGETLKEKDINSVLKAEAKPINFSSSVKYAEERKIVIKMFKHKREYYEITAENIRIALVDINDNGSKDIVYYVDDPQVCGKEFPCPFGIILREGDKRWKIVLEDWIRGSFDVLQTKKLGHSDVRANLSDENKAFQIWRFNGELYFPFLSGYTENVGEIETLSVFICDRKEKYRFVDRR